MAKVLDKRCRTFNHLSVFTAELSDIHQFLSWINTFGIDKYVRCVCGGGGGGGVSDNLHALQAINNPPKLTKLTKFTQIWILRAIR